MAFADGNTRLKTSDGTAKYTFRVSGSTEQVEMTAVNGTLLDVGDYEATVPSGYLNPKLKGAFGLDFIASKLYEDIFGKTFFTLGGASVGLLTDINENNYYQNVKADVENRPAGYFGLEG